MDRLDEILANAKIAISEYWKRYGKEYGSLAHNSSTRDEVVAAFEDFIAKLKGGLGFKDAAKILYGRLDALNQANGGGLLATDERELLVPIVIEAAKAVGVPYDEKGEDPGHEFRTF